MLSMIGHPGMNSWCWMTVKPGQAHYEGIRMVKSPPRAPRANDLAVVPLDALLQRRQLLGGAINEYPRAAYAAQRTRRSGQ